jgi:hypothetical protein
MKEEISGESRYLNGEHDNEVVTLDQASGQSPPSLEGTPVLQCDRFSLFAGYTER